MSSDMTETNGSEEDTETRTTISVDEEVWRQVRSQAVVEDKRVSEMLEDVLREHYGMTESTNN